MGCFRSMERTLMAAGMFLIGIGRHPGSEWRVWTKVPWMGTQYLGRFSDLPMAEMEISTNACQGTGGVSRTWRGQNIKSGTPACTWNLFLCLASCTSPSNAGAILSSARPRASFEVGAHKVFCGPFRYILHVCSNGHQWAHRNAAQTPTFAKSLCVCNYTQSGWDSPQSHSSKPCGDNSEVLGIEWAAAGNCTGRPNGAKQSSTKMAIVHRTQWLW